MQTYSKRVEEQVKKFGSYKEKIDLILQELEKEYEITIFFAAESGSRGLGIDVEDSDFDVTGFFVGKLKNYYKVIPKFEKTIKIIQRIITLDSKQYELDIELWEAKDWLQSKISKNSGSCDYWFTSPLIYRNLYPKITEKIEKALSPPILLYLGKAKSGIGYNEKDIKNKGNCLSKSLMNVVTSLFQYLHTQLYGNFPNFNILDEIDFIRNSKLKEEFKFTDDEYKAIGECAESYNLLLEAKTKSRKSTMTDIPQSIYNLMKILESKYCVKGKKGESNLNSLLLTEDEAQNIFDLLISKSN